MSRFKSIYIPQGLYFISTSLKDKSSHFLNRKPYVDIILGALNFLRKEKRILLFGFVIMPNHLHLILQLGGENNISQVMHSLKSYTSKKIISFLKQNNKRNLKGVWEQGFFDKNIETEKFLLEKMEYIHNNPVNKNWLLVKERTEYYYSSACFYDQGRKPIIEIDDLRKYYF